MTDRSSTPAVLLEGVTYRYPGAPGAALRDVDLRIDAQDFVGVVGPNGGGKTTLLQLMLGVRTPQTGTVRVFARPPATMQHRIGYVPQAATIDPSVPADVLDIVRMGRLARSSWGPRFDRRETEVALDALGRTGITALARRPYSELSGGQRQRVLIARALASEAEILLLDEPTAGVDLHRERELFALLDRLNERLPIVMVSHDITLVSSHMKRAVWVNRRVTSYSASDLTMEVVEDLFHAAEPDPSQSRIEGAPP